ncbi:MAG: hypothetical protein R3F48_14215 [Candidatus Zixiibacteriota bacterium]
MWTGRHAIFSIALICLMTGLFISGCSPKRKGTALANQPPHIGIVNTPPDGADFSRNPELSWYATDIDGYISFFRHAVILDTLLTINGVHVTPEEFIAQAPDSRFEWDTLIVDLDNPQSTATIQLYADTIDPVMTYTSQYFFVQACDDQGAMSEIAYRRYSRNNHFPNTHHWARDLFINAVNANSPATGIVMTWTGSDSTDWGRTEPPLEFEWRLYGPFDINDDIYVNIVQEDCVYDPTTQTYINCRDVVVLDIDAIPDIIYADPGDGRPVIPIPQPVAHSRGPNFANDPNDVWVPDNETTIYNVFKDLNLTKTSKYKFVFWVRSRDDGYVPDPTPEFSIFNVIEALFERDVAVIDESYYDKFNAKWCPRSLDTVKAVFERYIHGAGYADFDVEQDFFWRDGIKDYWSTNPDVTGRYIDLLDMLSHKVVIYHTDSELNGIDFTDSSMFSQLYLGLAQGTTVWVMSRNITSQGVQPIVAGTQIEMSSEFQDYFGIQTVGVEAFNYYTLNTNPPERWVYHPVFLEEFIAAYPATDEYPQINLLYNDSLAGTTDARIDSVYVRWWDYLNLPVHDHDLQGLPMVGIAYRAQSAQPVFLYYSRLGQTSIFHGKVCAVRSITNGTRTACFLFTPHAMDPGPMQETFTTTLDWLMEKFSSSAAKPGLDYTDFPDYLDERRHRTQEYLDYLSEFATPEEREQLGISIPPVVIH